MKLTFIGAAHEVTGSCHLLQAAGKNILIDCGMEQGPDLYENPGLPIAAGEVDYVFLTHAHIDHSGLLPLLCKNGFKGQILTTFATADLCNIMLRDSAHIQEFEAEWRNRKGRRAGVPEFEPLYVMADAEAAINLFVPHRTALRSNGFPRRCRAWLLHWQQDRILRYPRNPRLFFRHTPVGMRCPERATTLWNFWPWHIDLFQSATGAKRLFVCGLHDRKPFPHKHAFLTVVKWLGAHDARCVRLRIRHLEHDLRVVNRARHTGGVT